MNKRSLTFLAAFVVGAIAAFLINKNSLNTAPNTLRPTADHELAKTSVMITRMDGRSGGSGVILSSGPSGSEVLTNAHVCGVVKNGGVLTTETQSASVTSYKVSQTHDLCLISTKTNLGVNTAVARGNSLPFTAAVVVGHPQLYPTVITRGHFSKYKTIPIMTGTRPCTEEELNSDLQMVCLFLGGIPIIKIYESQLVTSTIMAGSSGSPVFNAAGEIGGLVFAGAGELSYGFIVPQEYVKNFVEVEAGILEPRLPDYTVNFSDLLERNGKRDTKKLLERCLEDGTPDQVKEICRKLTQAIILE